MKVNKANQNQKNIEPRQVRLYRNVFCSRVSTAVVLCLLASFLLQPIERIYAAENLTPEPNSEEIINLAVDAELVAPPAVEITAEEPTPETTEIIEVTELTATSTTSANETAELLTNNTTSTETISAVEVNASTTLLTDAEIDALLYGEDEEAVAIGPGDEEEITATTTENLVAVSTVFSDAVMQFNKQDCVTVEDGSFYCQNKKEETEQGSDGMYSLQDKDGDLEIFIQKNGALTQLTFNTVDDAAPSYDAKSNSIVWHRLVNERYQIIAFDLNTNQEVQLTADDVNNMEPSRSGDNTVWQRWNGTNWDIVLYNGQETKFITDSPLHDIAPNVKGDLVMWNRLTTNNTQTIELYDIATKEFTTISDDEGGALSNPRLVLVYETEFANGDVVTKGYDVDTGEITSLANNPTELPQELPEPEATGETKALVSPKNPNKDDAEISDDIFSAGSDNNLSASTSTIATSTLSANPGDLHIASSSPAIAGSTESATTTVSIQEMTLDLTPPVTLNPDLPDDLVIPTFIPDPSLESL